MRTADTVEVLMNRATLPFLRLLCNLRWAAIAGQVLTVAFVTGFVHVSLPALPLWAGIGALTAFNVFATWTSAC
jgi:two-component system, sensor histidine kinase RegB